MSNSKGRFQHSAPSKGPSTLPNYYNFQRSTEENGVDQLDILYVIGSLDLGGTERHLAQLAPLLKRQGWSLAIYCLTHSGIQRANLDREGITVIGPPVEIKTTLRLIRFLGLLTSCIKLFCILIRARPRIVHFFLPLSYLVGAPLAIASRISNRLMSRRSLNHYHKKHAVQSWFERRLHSFVTFAMGNSQAVVNNLWAEGVPPSRTVLIYNGIDLTPFDPLSPRTKAIHPRFVIIIVANLIPYKGHAELIEAIAGVSARMPADWELWCVGRNDGLLAILERLAKEKNIHKNVRFLGPRVDVPSLLKSADVSVSSSHEEGFSNAILEAMAAGLPVVATDVGGNAEAVVHGETGLIVPPQNPLALGEAILYLAQHPEIRERMGAAGRLRVQTRFSIDRCVQEYCDLYSKILEADVVSRGSVLATWQPKLILKKLVQSKIVRVSALLCVSFAALFVVVYRVGFSEIVRALSKFP